jgi:hypothetical protein
MTETASQKYLVLYLVPTSVIENWRNTDAAVRQPAEEKMRAAWGQWMNEHGKMILSTEAGGATKRVTKDGVADTKNEIMLYSFVEAESHEAAAKAFQDHPHFGIPQASIEVMAVRAMGGGA